MLDIYGFDTYLLHKGFLLYNGVKVDKFEILCEEDIENFDLDEEVEQEIKIYLDKLISDYNSGILVKTIHPSNQVSKDIKIDPVILFICNKAINKVYNERKFKDKYLELFNVSVIDNTGLDLLLYFSLKDVVYEDYFSQWCFLSRAFISRTNEKLLFYFYNIIKQNTNITTIEFNDKYSVWVFNFSTKLCLVFEYYLERAHYVKKLYGYWKSDEKKKKKKNIEVDYEQKKDLIGTLKKSKNIAKELKNTGTDKKFSKVKRKFYKFPITFKWEKNYDDYFCFTPPILRNNSYFFDKINYFVPVCKKNAFNDNYPDLDIKTLYYLSSQSYIYSKVYFNLLKPYFGVKEKNMDFIEEHQKILGIIKSLDNYFINKDSIKLYFIHTYDFRGRIYPKNPFGLTSIKLLRYCMDIPSTLKVNKNVYYNYYLEYIYLIKKDNIFNINGNNSEEKLVITLVGLYLLGRVNKSKLLKNCSVDLKTFIEEGIRLYKNFNIENFSKIYDNETLGYIVVHKEKLDNYLKFDKSFTIVVDSTASAYFHLNSACKIKPEYLYAINLDKNQPCVWYDTYEVFIYKTLEKMTSYDAKRHGKFFTRKTLKTVIMTIPYNLTLHTAFDYFFAKIPYSDIDIPRKELCKVFQEFYETLPLVFNELYEKDFRFLYQNNKVVNNYTINVLNKKYDFRYFKQIEDKVRKRLGKKYLEYMYYQNTDKLDEKKTQEAFSANFIHMIDALLVNLIYAKFYEIGANIYFVHDEFILDVKGYFTLVEEINYSNSVLYNVFTGENLKSCNILIII